MDNIYEYKHCCCVHSYWCLFYTNLTFVADSSSQQNIHTVLSFNAVSNSDWTSYMKCGSPHDSEDDINIENSLLWDCAKSQRLKFYGYSYQHSNSHSWTWYSNKEIDHILVSTCRRILQNWRIYLSVMVSIIKWLWLTSGFWSVLSI